MPPRSSSWIRVRTYLGAVRQPEETAIPNAAYRGDRQGAKGSGLGDCLGLRILLGLPTRGAMARNPGPSGSSKPLGPTLETNLRGNPASRDQRVCPDFGPGAEMMLCPALIGCGHGEDSGPPIQFAESGWPRDLWPDVFPDGANNRGLGPFPFIFLGPFNAGVGLGAGTLRGLQGALGVVRPRPFRKCGRPKRVLISTAPARL